MNVERRSHVEEQATTIDESAACLYGTLNDDAYMHHGRLAWTQRRGVRVLCQPRLPLRHHSLGLASPTVLDRSVLASRRKDASNEAAAGWR